MLETNDRKWSVYVHIVPKEISKYPYDKYYVGITKTKPSNRWGVNGNGYKTQVFGYAISKYGWDNIKHEILLEGLTEAEAKSYEQMYIEYYQSYDRLYGYNQTKGGDGHSVETKRVAQYSLDGKLIRIYKSSEYAAKVNGWKKVDMFSNRSHGYQWRYIENYDTLPMCLPPLKTHEWSKEVEKYDLFGNYIQSYESCNEAAKQNKLIVLNLRKDRTIISGEYQYKYADDDFEIENVFNRNNLMIPVYCYSIDGDYICRYENKKEALRKIGVFDDKLASIYEDYNIPFFVFYNIYNNLYKGYRWTYSYYEKLPPLIEVHYKEHPVIQLDKNFNLIDIFPHASYAVSSFNISYKNSHNNMISNACRKNGQYFISDNKKLTMAYKYIWFRFIDIDRLDIKISTLELLKKYYIYDQIIKDLERRNNKNVSNNPC